MTRREMKKAKQKQQIEQIEREKKQYLITRVLEYVPAAEKEQARTLFTKTSDELQQILDRIGVALQSEAVHLAQVKLRGVQSRGLLTAEQEERRILNAAANAVADLGLVDVSFIHTNVGAVKNNVEENGLAFTLENVVQAMLYGTLKLYRYSTINLATKWENKGKTI